MTMRRLHGFAAVLLLSIAGLATRPAVAGDKLTLDPRLALNACSALVEQQLDFARSGLRMLASTENVQSGDWSRIKAPLGEFAKAAPASAAVWFAQPDGSYFTVEAGLTDQNLKDRDYFPGLMGGKEVTGDLLVSKSTGKRSTIVAVPVQKDGRVIGALGASIDMEKMAALVEGEIALPAEVAFYALDQSGRAALHSQPKLLFEFAAEQGSPSLAAAVKEILSRREGAVHYDFQGAERHVIFRKAGPNGWTYALRW